MAYIDKDELLKSLEKAIKDSNEYRMAVVDSDFIDLVNDATVIEDVVEVVRCKDCKHCEYRERYEGLICHCAKGIVGVVNEDDFCSYGERKDESTM